MASAKRPPHKNTSFIYQNSFPAIVPKPANLDSYLTPLELHVLNPAAGARDEYISPPKPRPQQRLPKLPGISSNRLNGDGVSVHSTTAASKKVGRQDEAGQANSCQPAHHETIKAFRPDAVPGGLPSSKKAKTSSGLWGDLSKTAFGPPPAPVPPAWKARSLGTTYGVTLEPIDPSPAAPGPGEGAKGLMTMKSGRMVGLPPFGGTRRMPTGRRGCIETFRQAVALATAKKPVQHRQLLSEAMFKYLFRNPVLQAPELVDALQCIDESLPPQLQLVAAGLFVQQCCYFSAVRAVVLHPHLLMEAVPLLLGNADECGEALSPQFKWQPADREIFVLEYESLPIVQSYVEARIQLHGLGASGQESLRKIEFNMLLKAMQNFLSQATATVEAKFAAELEAKRLREEAERQQFEELTRQQAMEELLQEAEGLLDGGDLQEYVDEHLADRIADRIVEEHEIREAARVEYIKSGVQSKLGLQGWEEKQRQMRKAAKEKRMQAVLESIGDNWGLESILTPEQMRALREKRRREELKRLAQEAKERKAREAFCRAFTARLMRVAVARAERELREEERERAAAAAEAEAKARMEAELSAAISAQERADKEVREKELEAREATAAAKKARLAAIEARWTAQAEGADETAASGAQKAEELAERLAKVSEAADQAVMAKMSMLAKINKLATKAKMKFKTQLKKARRLAKAKARADARAQAMEAGEEQAENESDASDDDEGETDFVAQPHPLHEAECLKLREAEAEVKAAVRKLEAARQGRAGAAEALQKVKQERRATEAALAQARRRLATGPRGDGPGDDDADGGSGSAGKDDDPAAEAQAEVARTAREVKDSGQLEEWEKEAKKAVFDLEGDLEFIQVSHRSTSKYVLEAMGAEATAEASVAEARAAEVAAAASVLRVSESLRSAARSKVNSMTEELLASARQFAAAEEALAVAQDAAIKGALTAVGAKAAARTIAAGDLKGGEPEDLGAGRAAGREGANGPGRATDRADDHSINLLQLESALQEAPSPPKTVEELGNDLQEAEFRYDDALEAHRHALKVFQWWSTKARDAFNAQGAALRAELQSVRDFCGRFEEAVWGAGEAREDAEEALNAAEWSVTDAREQVQDTLKAIGDLTKADAEADGEGGEEAGPRAAARTAHAPVSRKAGGGKEGESPEEEEEAEGAAEPKTIEGLEADLRLAEANVQIAEAALVRANTDVKEADQAAEVAAALKKQASEKLAAALDSQVCATRRHERDLADEWYDVVLDLQAVSEEQRDAENGYMEAARALEAAKAADDAERSGPDESAVSKNIVLEARLRGATVVKMKADMVVRRAKEAADSTACLRGLCEKAARAAEQSKNQHMPPVERVWKPGEEVERLIAQEAARDAAEHALLRARAALSEAAEASDAAVCEWAQAYESVQEALEAGKTGDEPFQVDAAEEGGRLEAGNEDSAGQEEEKQSGDKAAARKEEEAVDSDDEEAPAVTQPRTLNEALEAAAIKVKTAEHRAAMLARKLRLQELAAVLAAKKEAEAAEAKFTSAEKTYSDCRKALTKEDRASKQARRALRAAAKAVDDAEGALEAIKDNPDATLEDFDQTEEAHHAADVAHQEAMDFVVQAENRKLAAVQARDEALEYLRATVLSRCPRTEKTRILAEEGWGEAVAFLQAAIERRDDASAGVDAALEALQEARRALQEAGEAEAAAAAGAGGDGDAPPPDAKGSASAAGAPIPIRILESKLVAAEAIKAAAESAATRGVEAVKRADIKMRECETVESDTKLYHHKLLPENAPKKPKSLLDPMEQAVVEAEQTWQKSFRQIAEAKASWLETLQQEMAVYHQKWLQAEVKLGEAKDADTSREQEHAELEAEVEAALEELAKAEGRTAAALEEVASCEQEEMAALEDLDMAKDELQMDAEDKYVTAKDDFEDADDAHYVSKMAMTEAERELEKAKASGDERKIAKASRVYDGAKQATIAAERALRFSTAERDRCRHRLEGVLDDLAFKAEAMRQRAAQAIRQADGEKEEASERHIAATRDYFAAGFAVNKAEEEAGEALPHLAKNAALRAAEEAKQKAAQILARAKAKIPMLEQRLKYCEGAKETAQKRAEKIREPEVRRERKTIKTKEERAKEEAARQAAIAAERARRAEEARKVLEAEEAELSKIREHEERLARADEERAKITSKVSEEKRKAQQRIAEERKKVMDEMAKLAQEEGKKGELEAAARLAEVRMQREALQGRMHELDHQREFVEAAMRGEKQLDEVLGEAASQPEKIMRTITMVKMRMQQEEVPDDSLERARRRMEEHRKKMAEKIAAKREELNAEREAKRAEMEVEEQRKMSHLTRGASNVSAATLVSTQPKEEARREMRERRAAETEALRKRLEEERKKFIEVKANVEARRAQQIGEEARAIPGIGGAEPGAAAPPPPAAVAEPATDAGGYEGRPALSSPAASRPPRAHPALPVQHGEDAEMELQREEQERVAAEEREGMRSASDQEPQTTKAPEPQTTRPDAVSDAQSRGGGDDGDPTQEEILEYAVYLGIDPVEDADLVYIAEWALTAPLTEGWTGHLDQEGNEFFYNSATGVSTYQHPLDEQYRAYYRSCKQAKLAAAAGSATASGGAAAP